MPTHPPPPRYRVVERGRRLEVIDTRTGEAIRPSPVPAASERAGAGRWPTLPEQQGFDGRGVLATHRWYDAKAPRRVSLDPVTMQRLGLAKGVAIVGAMTIVLLAIAIPAVLAFLLAPLALLDRRPREAARAGVTAWLDRLDPA